MTRHKKNRSKTRDARPASRGSENESANEANDANEASAEAARKERVLHTRVPEVLEVELKRLADNLRIPVSNLVRAILEDAMTVADKAGQRTEEHIRGWAERLHDERDRLKQRVQTVARRGDSNRPVDANASAEPGERATKPIEPSSGATSSNGASDGVIGYQPLMLAAASTCTRCGVELPAGAQAYLGLRETPGPRVLLGAECLTEK